MDSHELALERRQAILGDAVFQQNPGFAGVLKDLANDDLDDLYERLTRYLDFDNADKTSNHPERENREFRKRQHSHYRLRSRRSFCTFLNAHTVQREPPANPRQLTRRRPIETQTEEVLPTCTRSTARTDGLQTPSVCLPNAACRARQPGSRIPTGRDRSRRRVTPRFVEKAVKHRREKQTGAAIHRPKG